MERQDGNLLYYFPFPRKYPSRKESRHKCVHRTTTYPCVGNVRESRLRWCKKDALRCDRNDFQPQQVRWIEVNNSEQSFKGDHIYLRIKSNTTESEDKLVIYTWSWDWLGGALRPTFNFVETISIIIITKFTTSAQPINSILMKYFCWLHIVIKIRFIFYAINSFLSMTESPYCPTAIIIPTVTDTDPMISLRSYSCVNTCMTCSTALPDWYVIVFTWELPVRYGKPL